MQAREIDEKVKKSMKVNADKRSNANVMEIQVGDTVLVHQDTVLILNDMWLLDKKEQ